MTDPVQERQPGEGPFYIEPDCCLLCGVPESIAPELFRTGSESCSLLRQPAGEAEIDKTITAMWSSEVDCIRYRGSDREILRRLGEARLADLADNPAAKDFRPVERDLVLFSVPDIPPDKPLECLAASFRDYLRAQERFTVRRVGHFRKRRVSFSWYGAKFHSVTFEGSGRRDSYMAVLDPKGYYALKGLGRVVHDWLKSEARAHDIAWYNRAGLLREEAGAPNPF